jgi:hypothetical protein
MLKVCCAWNLRLQHRQNDSGSISRIEKKENPMHTNEIDPPRVALVTGAGERQRRRLADAGASAGDDGDPGGRVSHRDTPSSMR